MITNNYYIKDLDDFFYWLGRFVFKKPSRRKEVSEHFHKEFSKHKKIVDACELEFEDLGDIINDRDEDNSLLHLKIVELEGKIKDLEFELSNRDHGDDSV